MTGIYQGEGSSYQFDQEKYRIIFEGMQVTFLLKPEHEHRNRPSKMILNYSTKKFYREFSDGYNSIENFVGVI